MNLTWNDFVSYGCLGWLCIGWLRHSLERAKASLPPERGAFEP